MMVRYTRRRRDKRRCVKVTRRGPQVRRRRVGIAKQWLSELFRALHTDWLLNPLPQPSVVPMYVVAVEDETFNTRPDERQ